MPKCLLRARKREKKGRKKDRRIQCMYKELKIEGNKEKSEKMTNKEVKGEGKMNYSSLEKFCSTLWFTRLTK